jgi:hypothetical protein
MVQAGSVASHRTGDLHGFGHSDHDERPQCLGEPRLDEQRHFVADERLTRRRQRGDFGLGQLAHARMRDGIELCAQRLVAEHHIRQRLAIQITIGKKNAGPELSHNLRQPGTFRSDDFSRQLIGVDHRQPALAEASRHRAFPRADSASKPENVRAHGASLVSCLRRPLQNSGTSADGTRQEQGRSW